jgi:hypothetical protein
MDQRHFEIALISLFIAALMAGADAGLQAVPANGAVNLQSVVIIGALTFATTLLASLKSLYQQNPSAPKDGLLAVAEGFQPVLAQVLANLLSPRPIVPPPMAPTPAVLFQPRTVASVAEAVAPIAPVPAPVAVSTDAPTHP